MRIFLCIVHNFMCKKERPSVSGVGIKILGKDRNLHFIPTGCGLLHALYKIVNSRRNLQCSIQG